MKKILVWHQGALGDLLLSLPAIFAIKEHSGPLLHLVCRSDLADIILHNRIADEISSNEKGLFADLFSKSPAPEELREFLGQFSTAFVFMKKQDPDFFTSIHAYVPECLFVSTNPPSVSGISMRDWQFTQLCAAGLPVPNSMPVLDPAEFSSMVRPEKTVFALHPGSGGKRKCWPFENYMDLIRMLASENQYFFRIIFGPAESPEIREQMVRFVAENRLPADIVANRPLTEIAYIIKMSSLYAGNDSGITHLAAMLGTPTIALFGPTDHTIWGPKGKYVRIIRSGYPCSPCSDDAMKRCRDIRCLGMIGASDVLNALRKML